MCFAVLSLSQLFHAFGMRSEKPVIKAGLFKNPMLLLALAVSAAVQLAVMLIPSAASVFGVVALNGELWVITVLLSAAPFVLGEIRKLFVGK